MLIFSPQIVLRPDLVAQCCRQWPDLTPVFLCPPMWDAGSAGAVPQISGLGSAVMIQTLDSPPMQAAALFCRTLRSLRFRIWERYEPLLMIQSSEVGLPHALPADDQLDLEMTPEGGLGYLGLGRVLASSVLMQSFVQTLGAQKLSDQDFAILLRDVVSGLVG